MKHDPHFSGIIGPRVKAYRILRGYTQEELANKVGLSVPPLGKIERGQSTPIPYTLQRLALALEVTVDDLTRES
jgi:transcriptional regulator with XRE-family HTH domain